VTAASQKLVKQQRIVDEWNAAHPVGTRVEYWTWTREGEGKKSVTRSQAQIMCGHAVVWVKGHPACIALTHVEPISPVCAYCGGPSEGNYTVHRDGFGVGPEVELCDVCGGGRFPTLSMIWKKIARPEASA
jgi:hypothetical protein